MNLSEFYFSREKVATVATARKKRAIFCRFKMFYISRSVKACNLKRESDESKDVQMQEGKVDMESSGTMLDEQDTSSRSRNDADTEDAVIRPDQAVPVAHDNGVCRQHFRLQRSSEIKRKKVEATLKSAWTEKDQIDNLLKERRLMRSLEKFVGQSLRIRRILKDGHGVQQYYYDIAPLNSGDYCGVISPWIVLHVAIRSYIETGTCRRGASKGASAADMGLLNYIKAADPQEGTSGVVFPRKRKAGGVYLDLVESGSDLTVFEKWKHLLSETGLFRKFPLLGPSSPRMSITQVNVGVPACGCRVYLLQYTVLHRARDCRKAYVRTRRVPSRSTTEETADSSRTEHEQETKREVAICLSNDARVVLQKEKDVEIASYLPEACSIFKPCLEQPSVPIYHAVVNVVLSGRPLKSFALLNVSHPCQGGRKHVAALHSF
ncbi:hypothetical protein Tco_1262703 [Tanacetum coccineum]